MSRTPIQLRHAVPGDVPRLVELWADVVRRAEPADQELEMGALVERVSGCDDERLLVAEVHGEVAGAVLLQAAQMSPINVEPVVRVVNPYVFPDFQRRGVGQVLVDAGVAFAEERGIGHVASASTSSWRDANRFMARLGLGQYAVLRVAPTHAVRTRLTALRPRTPRANRHLDRVLATRRVRRERAAG